MDTALTWLTENWFILESIAAHLLAAAALIARFTKTKKDDEIIEDLQDFLDGEE